MNWNDPRTLLWTAALFYGAACLLGIVRALKGKGEKGGAATIPFVLALIAFLIQTKGLYLRGLDVRGCPLGNGMERIQFILWSVALGYLIVRIFFRLNLLGSFSSGLAGAGGAASLLFPALDVPYWKDPAYGRLFADHWIELHASVAIFSYGVFALLAVVSVMYLLQQRALREKRPGRLSPFLPSIRRLESGGASLLLVGVVFLSASMAVGALHWVRAPENVGSLKLGLTVLLWIAYCILWFLHFKQRLYGRKFAQVCIALFLGAILSLGFLRSRDDAPQGPQPNSSEQESVR